MYGCRECDYDLCTRCIVKLGKVERPRALSLDSVPEQGVVKSKSSAGTKAVADKVAARKSGIRSPGSPMDGARNGEQKKKDGVVKSMSKDFFAAMTTNSEERREKERQKRVAAEERKKAKEEFVASQAAIRARMDAEKKEALEMAKANAADLKEMNKANAVVLAEAKQAEKDRKALEKEKKEKAAKLAKEKKEREAEAVKREKDAAKAREKANGAKAKGKPMSEGWLFKLPSVDLRNLMGGGLSKKDEAKVEAARKKVEKEEKLREKAAAMYEGEAARFAAEVKEREAKAKEAAIARKRLLEERNAEFKAVNAQRRAEFEVVAKERGDEAALAADGKARVDLAKSDERQERCAETSHHTTQLTKNSRNFAPTHQPRVFAARACVGHQSSPCVYACACARVRARAV